MDELEYKKGTCKYKIYHHIIDIIRIEDIYYLFTLKLFKLSFHFFLLFSCSFLLCVCVCVCLSLFTLPSSLFCVHLQRPDGAPLDGADDPRFIRGAPPRLSPLVGLFPPIFLLYPPVFLELLWLLFC